MRTLTALLLAGLAFAPATALAGSHVRVSVGVPAVNVVIDPWGPAYVPAPRAGYAWVNGYYDNYGYWHPGHWVPTARRSGYVWVPGYWSGPHYVDGYWRPAARPGYVWRDGYYRGGAWVGGGWVDHSHYKSAYEWREDRREAWEDARERREDRAERWEDAQERREDRAERWEDAQERREDRSERYEDRNENREDRAEQREDRGEDRDDRRERGSNGRSRHHDYE